MMAGMFTIDSHLAYVLSDFGASHSFMSLEFIEKHNIPLRAMSIAFKISTPGAFLCVNTQTDTVKLELATHTYRLQFLVPSGQGIDAIHGMNWLKAYGVTLNLRQRVI
jgi:hypothetical protein